ncbi:MAG: hypothetical protein U0R17_05920 [Acidimicrobiia bacterium]
MFLKQLTKKQIVIFVAAFLAAVLVLIIVFSSDDDNKPSKPLVITTTTTLPAKNAQACEFLTDTALLAGGIVADVEPKITKDKKRCTYSNIGKEINYITLYVDSPAQCAVLFDSQKNKVAIPDVAKNAIYSDETDPTIIVSQTDRCFFVQGSKTIVDKTSLSAIAKTIVDLFVAVDSSTTTTTPTTAVGPPSSTQLPGQNTATSAASTSSSAP